MINNIECLAGVVAVWYYPEGIENIISQHRIAAFSRWRASHDTYKNNEKVTTKTDVMK